MAKNDKDVLEEVSKRRKKKRLKWLEEESEAHMRPVRWKARGRR